MRKKRISWMLVVAMILSLIPFSAMTAYASVEEESYDAVINVVDGTGTGVGWTFASGEIWINEDGSYLISGNGIQTSNRVRVNTGVTASVTLDNVNINVNLPFECGDNSNVTVVLADDSNNTFQSWGGHAGLRVKPTAKLTITTAGQGLGNGSLSAYGDADNPSHWASAGIGGSELESSGTIIINGGTIFAKGGNGRTPGAWRGPGAAGIGGAQGRASGDITINGGTVTAIGGDVNPEGAGIGGGSSDSSTYGGKITISGGTVRAYSGQNGTSGTGIGFCSTIAIADTADVKAYSSGNYPAIYGTADTTGHSAFLLNFMLDMSVSQDTDITIAQIDDGTELFEMTLLANYKNFAATVETAESYNAESSDGSKKIVSIPDESTEFPGICDLPGTALSSVDAKMKANPVCMIGSTGYETLNEALVAVSDGHTITLIQDINYGERIWVGSSYSPSLTLDLNGYELKISNVEVPIAAIDGYDITVTDSSEYGGGTLILNTTSGDSAPTGITAVGSGSSVLVDSKITTIITANGVNSKGVSAYHGGSVQIDSGSITSDTYGIYTYGMTGDVASLIAFTGNVSALSDYGIGVYAENSGTAMVTGEITGPYIGYGVIAYEGFITITGNVASSGFAATARGSGTVTVTGNATATGEFSRGAYAYEGGTVNISGNVAASGSYEYGVYADNGSCITVGGNVSQTGSNGVGAYAAGFSEGSEITIDGSIDAAAYIQVAGEYKEPDDRTEPTTKTGYYTYSYGDPVSTVWVKNVYSNDADLASLSATNVTLSPAFQSSTTSYSANAANNIASATLAATANNGGATIKINGTIATSKDVSLNVGNNVITVEVTAEDGVTTKTYTITINRATASCSSGGGFYTPPTIVVTTDTTKGSTSNSITLNPNVSSGIASAAVTKAMVNALLDKAGEAGGTAKGDLIEVIVNTPADTEKLTFNIPQPELEKIAGETSADFGISSPFVSIVFDGKAVDTISGVESGGTVSITATRIADLNGRPVYDLTVMNGNTQVSDFKGGHATVTVPYELKSGESPNAIVIYYLADNGTLKAVRGHYNESLKAVVFKTTHFSSFVIGYNPVSFNDVAADAWHKNAVDFIAARGITSGTGDNIYSPEAKLTRAQFVVLLMNAYHISTQNQGELSQIQNFSDAGNTYFTDYLLTAKALGIVNGIGNNLFAPGKEITRQEMFVMLYNALKVIDGIPAYVNNTQLSSFNDADKIASWANEAFYSLVKTGTVAGYNNSLYPTATTTRAEIAQVLYNLLSK